MVEFRRWITALAVLALFAGLASAQVGGGGTTGGPLTCTATVAVPPLLRAEGMTELIGDIVITCSGGTATPVGTAIPTANITVSLGTNVTSRILSSTGSTGASEALLLIDEPGVTSLPAPVAGQGPQAPQTVCSSSSIGAGAGGCVENAANATVNGGTIQYPVAAAGGQAANVFQGLVSANQVTFQGIPILAPVSSGVTRVFRITNVRANVSGLGVSGLPGTSQLLASVSISGSTSVPVNNPVQVAGFIESGITATVRNADSSGSQSGFTFNQCGPGGSQGGNSYPAPTAILRYAENFGTAFKTRVAPTSVAGSGQLGQGVVQNIPGTIYNSESGFILPSVPTSYGFTAGLADYGTRLKAVFNNIPAGVRVYVSVTNVVNETSGNATIANTTFAQLINGEASPDANGYAPVLSPTVLSTCTSSYSTNGGTCSTSSTGIMGLYDITNGGAVASTSYTAVWEVINTNPSQNETLNFAVFTLFTPNAASNLPAPGLNTTVNMNYAPAPPVPFSVSGGSTASGTYTVPRFADVSTAKALFTIQICQTLLLFPFVTNTTGFDTGIAIANTSADPVGTGAQAGTCALSWYGTPTTPNTNVSSIASGAVYTTLASTSAPGFTGYMFALCNFQYAHGFAFISDIGARNLAMGYLALVINNGNQVTRGGSPGPPPGESAAH